MHAHPLGTKRRLLNVGVGDIAGRCARGDVSEVDSRDFFLPLVFFAAVVLRISEVALMMDGWMEVPS